MKKIIISITLVVVLVGIFAIFSSQQTPTSSNSQSSLSNVYSSSHSLDEFLEEITQHQKSQRHIALQKKILKAFYL